MSQTRLPKHLPELDGPRALLLIGILDAIIAELWLHYGEVIVRDAEAHVEELEDTSDLPF